MKQESTLLYIGRVTGERTLEAFLRYPGYTRKFVVGNGHARAALMRKNPEVTFLGVVPEVRLREWYARADVVIFGDEAATRGDVLVEALACGTPVAAPNEPNAREIITDASLGCCHDDILLAIRAALAQGSRERCAAYAHTHSWRKSADTFIRHLVPIASWAPDGNTNFSNADDFRVGIEPPVNDATRLTRLGFSQCSAPILD
jgi:glycosyltransferase involved in cell wall biosynthesis